MPRPPINLDPVDWLKAWSPAPPGGSTRPYPLVDHVAEKLRENDRILSGEHPEDIADWLERSPFGFEATWSLDLHRRTLSLDSARLTVHLQPNARTRAHGGEVTSVNAGEPGKGSAGLAGIAVDMHLSPVYAKSGERHDALTYVAAATTGFPRQDEWPTDWRMVDGPSVFLPVRDARRWRKNHGDLASRFHDHRSILTPALARGVRALARRRLVQSRPRSLVVLSEARSNLQSDAVLAAPDEALPPRMTSIYAEEVVRVLFRLERELESSKAPLHEQGSEGQAPQRWLRLFGPSEAEILITDRRGHVEIVHHAHRWWASISSGPTWRRWLREGVEKGLPESISLDAELRFDHTQGSAEVSVRYDDASGEDFDPPLSATWTITLPRMQETWLALIVELITASTYEEPAIQQSVFDDLSVAQSSRRRARRFVAQVFPPFGPPDADYVRERLQHVRRMWTSGGEWPDDLPLHEDPFEDESFGEFDLRHAVSDRTSPIDQDPWGDVADEIDARSDTSPDDVPF